ncbi:MULTISPECIES: molybdenum cofactor biosynthesis protein MoaE [unclassified Flavobacterium]|uniref:molybdenum cofactor biosynthesis protein MoaE n=1 Tax=unclassified Flavobacterium TaxID=196869 RepID=UPI000C197F46|nr:MULTISPECIES: molybdenum cofactor biosynthesis protein MoaE [unclassified Flavobacterium]PIF60969.1 molybdopterin synthase catalytic subunit [Flavobacterium sp. 11]WKL45356.1 molybdenum cofactor biosynthesis protein MoaE [Flavobacterium sp. ZE23DGlu08]
MSKKTVFIQGPISSEFIGQSIAKHQSKTTIGAHNIFLGQVRADVIDSQTVVAIDYTAYEEMADEALSVIREKAFAQFDLICMHIYHSLGTVKAGEICLFVFVSATRRKQVYDATETIVNWIKTDVPIFGKEIFENSTFTWKKNSL